MGVAARDENNVPTLLGALSTDGFTPIAVKASPSTHKLSVSDGASGTDHGRNVATRDANDVPVLLAASSTDGVTPVEVYANSLGQLLINSH